MYLNSKLNNLVNNFKNLSGVGIKKIFVVLFKYPDIFDTLIYPWGQAIPIIFLCEISFEVIM